MSLSDAAIRNAKPQKKSIRLFDERGLYVEISPAGGKWWRYQYRFNGKEKRVSLGTYPSVSLKDARDRRDVARRLLAAESTQAKIEKRRNRLAQIEPRTALRS
jgi:hypothetical protein